MADHAGPGFQFNQPKIDPDILKRLAGLFLRPDGTPKGNGFLGPLVADPNTMASEYSVSTDKFGGHDFPSIVPTLTAAELNQVLNGYMSPEIVMKAQRFAAQRQREGKPLFAQEGEQHYGVLPMFQRLGR